MTNNQKSNNMFSQKVVFGGDQETIHQGQLEQDLNVTPSSSKNVANGPQRESFTVLLIGSRKVVTSIIHYLHSMGHVEVGDWTPLEPCPSNREKVMSTLERKITVH